VFILSKRAVVAESGEFGGVVGVKGWGQARGDTRGGAPHFALPPPLDS